MLIFSSWRSLRVVAALACVALAPSCATTQGTSNASLSEYSIEDYKYWNAMMIGEVFTGAELDGFGYNALFEHHHLLTAVGVDGVNAARIEGELSATDIMPAFRENEATQLVVWYGRLVRTNLPGNQVAP